MRRAMARCAPPGGLARCRTMPGYSVRLLEDLPTIPSDDLHDPLWRPIQHVLGLTAFGLNAYTARAPGDSLLEEHDERGRCARRAGPSLAGRLRVRRGGLLAADGPGGRGGRRGGLVRLPAAAPRAARLLGLRPLPLRA